MAQNRSELLKLLRGFTPSPVARPSATQTRKAGASAVATRKAVQDIAKGRGVSTTEAIDLLRQTQRELVQARKAIQEIARNAQGPTTARQLGIDILKVRPPVRTAQGDRLRLQVSQGVAMFAARSELASPSTRLRVFGSQAQLKASPPTRPSGQHQPGQARTSPVSRRPRRPGRR